MVDRLVALPSEHVTIMHEDAGMMNVLIELMDDLETLIRHRLVHKRRSDFG